jgi:signal peptidase I
MEAFLETTQQEEQTRPRQDAQEDVNLRRLAFDILETLILAIVLFIGINAISARVRVDGESMLPTLKNGEFVLVNKLSYRFGDVQRGDIIVFHFPMNREEELIKRVIGLPGDHVVIQNQQVSVNDQPISEPYIASAPLYAGEWTVTDGHLFVLGDNRNDSSDSHSWGLLPNEEVVGKAILIYWPPPFWEVIEHVELIPAP